LPPFIGVLIALAFVSLVSIIYHRKKTQEEKDRFSVAYALTKVDVSSILIFYGNFIDGLCILQEVQILSHANGSIFRTKFTK
jgi:hypothetical protein